MKYWLPVAAIIALCAGMAWLVFSNFGLLPAGDFPSPNSSRWQAVFLINGQVYFGHLENYNRGYARLTSVYYLRAADALQQGRSEAGESLNLVKLGGELHGPEDAMFIAKDSMLFWENMGSTSEVVRAILSAERR